MVYLELFFLFLYNPEYLTLLGLSFALKYQGLCHLCIQSLSQTGLLLARHRHRLLLLWAKVEITEQKSGSNRIVRGGNLSGKGAGAKRGHKQDKHPHPSTVGEGHRCLHHWIHTTEVTDKTSALGLGPTSAPGPGGWDPPQPPENPLL